MTNRQTFQDPCTPVVEVIVAFVFTALACVVYDFWWKDEPEETRRDFLVSLKFLFPSGLSFLVVVSISFVVGSFLPVGIFLTLHPVNRLLRRGWWWISLGVGFLALLVRTTWADSPVRLFLLAGGYTGVLLPGRPQSYSNTSSE